MTPKVRRLACRLRAHACSVAHEGGMKEWHNFPVVTLYLTRQGVFRYSLTAPENTTGDILVPLTVLVLWSLRFHLLLL